MGYHKLFYRPFKCSICNKKFCSKNNLQQHVSEVHEKNKPFKCSTCDKRFGKKFGQQRHEARSCKKKNTWAGHEGPALTVAPNIVTVETPKTTRMTQRTRKDPRLVQLG